MRIENPIRLLPYFPADGAHTRLPVNICGALLAQARQEGFLHLVKGVPNAQTCQKAFLVFLIVFLWLAKVKQKADRTSALQGNGSSEGLPLPGLGRRSVSFLALGLQASELLGQFRPAHAWI